MTFMFGDLSAAPLTTNFLEELRDAIDFAGAIAEADQVIATVEATRDGLHRRVDQDIAKLAALVGAMTAAADTAQDGVAAQLASELIKLIAERRDAAEVAIRAKLADDLRATEAATLVAREDYFPILEEYLLAKEPPGSGHTIRAELVAAGKKDHRYVAESTGQSEIGLDWTIEMAVPEEGLWSGPLRVDQVAEDLSVLAPQRSGLIKKDVKLKQQRLDRYLLTTIVDDGAAVRVELRTDITEPVGFTLAVDLDRRSVNLAKTGDDADPTVGSFDVGGDDEAALFDFAAKLRAMLRQLPKKRLVSAGFDGLPFDGTNTSAQPNLVRVVSRLVERLAPTVVEIGARSRSVDELVLRRVLSDGLREELFLPKARLRERLAPLDAAHKKLFAAVASAIDASPALAALPVDVSEPAPPVRSEIPLSVPGPLRRKSGNMAAVLVAKPSVADAKKTLIIDEEPPAAEPDAGPVIEPPSSKAASVGATLDQIRALANEGQLDEAFRRYATLFATSAFTTCGPDAQREALRRMIFGKVPPSPSDEIREAYRTALPFVQALVLEQRGGADYEMLGMTYAALNEPEKAAEMFSKALEIERTRDPASELCGSLMRRLGHH